MTPYEFSEPGQPPHLSSTIIPDLTDKITRSDDQYCAAGGFGDVFRCRYASNDGVREVAVKAFRFGFSVDENKHDERKSARMIRRELGIWKRLRHPNIVPFLGIAHGFGIQGNASLVSMWMPNGTLHTFLEAHDDQLVIAHRLRLLLDIANGLHYLHSFPMIHGDLSSSNVLVDHNYNACLTDFGCASLIGELPKGLTYLKMTTMIPGNLRWAAPEHFSLDEEETKHTTKSDIYSFGSIALLALSGKYPWSEIRTDAAVVRRLFQGLRPGRPLEQPIDDQHWALIEQCWSSNPEERPLTGDVVSSLHQFLSAARVPGALELAAVLSQNTFASDGCIDGVLSRTVVLAPTANTHNTPGQLIHRHATGNNIRSPFSPCQTHSIVPRDVHSKFNSSRPPNADSTDGILLPLAPVASANIGSPPTQQLVYPVQSTQHILRLRGAATPRPFATAKRPGTDPYSSSYALNPAYNESVYLPELYSLLYGRGNELATVAAHQNNLSEADPPSPAADTFDSPFSFNPPPLSQDSTDARHVKNQTGESLNLMNMNAVFGLDGSLSWGSIMEVAEHDYLGQALPEQFHNQLPPPDSSHPHLTPHPSIGLQDPTMLRQLARRHSV